MMAALKFLSGNSNTYAILVLASVVFSHSRWDFPGSWYDMWFFSLYSGHCGYYVMRLWILVKSSFLAGLLWHSGGCGRGSCLSSAGWELKFRLSTRLPLTSPWLGEGEVPHHCSKHGQYGWGWLRTSGRWYKFQIPIQPLWHNFREEWERSLITSRWRWKSSLPIQPLLTRVGVRPPFFSHSVWLE